MSTYATRDEAIQREILPALGDYASDFDAGAIFDACFRYDAERGGFVMSVDADGFWESVKANDNTSRR